MSKDELDDLQKEIFGRNLSRLVYSKYPKQQKDIADDIGFPATTFNTWCQGKVMPGMGKVQKIADYFGVGKSKLLDEQNDTTNESYYLDDETTKMATEIKDNKELKLLFDAARDSSPEDLNTVHQMLLALKRKERGE